MDKAAKSSERSERFRIRPEHFAEGYVDGVKKLNAYQAIKSIPNPTSGQIRSVSKRYDVKYDTVESWARYGVVPQLVRSIEQMKNIIPLDHRHPNFNKALFLAYAVGATGHINSWPGYNLLFTGERGDLKVLKRELFDRLGIRSSIRGEGTKQRLLPENPSVLGRVIAQFGVPVGEGAKQKMRIPPELIAWASVVRRRRMEPAGGSMPRDAKIAARAVDDYCAAMFTKASPMSFGRMRVRMHAQTDRENAAQLGRGLLRVMKAAMPDIGLSGNHLRIEPRARKSKNREVGTLWTPTIVMPRAMAEKLKRDYPHLLRLKPSLRV